MNPDHFSNVARQYARSRPTYPPELFAWLARTCARHDLCWDVGAGSGQASAALAWHFARVVATDLSEAQIEQATSHPRVEYRVAPATESGLAAHSVDLVSVAQALHWFDWEPFYAEVHRVLKPRGVIAAWTYGVMTIEGAGIQERFDHFYRNVVGPYWPPERQHVEDGYARIPFPFEEIPAPAFAIELSWALAELLGYCRSWSASGHYLQETGVDAVDELERDLVDLWGEPQQRRAVTWPIAMRAGRV